MKAIAETMGVSRTDQYRQPKSQRVAGKRFYRRVEDGQYLPLIRAIVDERITYGYRRVAALLSRALKIEGKPLVNHKRVYRMAR